MRSIENDGFAIFANVYSSDEVRSILRTLPEDAQEQAGMRHALRDPEISKLAHGLQLMRIAHTVLGPTAFPFRATFFSKTPKINWLVTWHQDRALPMREKRETPGWGPWSVKAGVAYAGAPADALGNVLALRVHLDDSVAANGPLRVLPGTHRLGVLAEDAVHELARQLSPVDCLVPRGGVLAMRPLLVHSSSKLREQIPRRVLHIEYAESAILRDGLELAVV